MNPYLLQFIMDHASDDTDKLLLSKKRWEGIDVELAVNTIEGRRRIAHKVPQWGERYDLLYPTTLCAQQCSSSQTASYKASVARSLFERKPKIADLTGGLGVDSWFFSQIAEAVLYNEANEVLAESVRENFSVLGADKVKFSKKIVERGQVSEILEGFNPDLVYLDPARRSVNGKKLFLLEDCQPDVLTLKDEIFQRCRFLLLKLSPMADIKMLVGRLGKVREIHIVAYKDECKELLVLLDRDFEGQARIVVNEAGSLMCFGMEDSGTAEYPSKTESLAGRRLFEPGKALMKSGMFNSLCSRLNLVKLGRSTNLYLTRDDGTECAEYGKLYSILEDLPFNKRTMDSLGSRLDYAEVSARNIPMTSEVLAKRLKFPCKNPGSKINPHHVFGVRIDYRDSPSENRLLVSRK